MKKQIVVPFNVQVDRVHDIQVEEGTKVARLKAMLAANGLDVNDARITIDSIHGTIIGRVENHELEDGDCVQFDTREMDIPGLRQEVEEEEEEERIEAKTITNGHIKLERIPDGLIIRFI